MKGFVSLNRFLPLFQCDSDYIEPDYLIPDLGVDFSFDYDWVESNETESLLTFAIDDLFSELWSPETEEYSDLVFSIMPVFDYYPDYNDSDESPWYYDDWYDFDWDFGWDDWLLELEPEPCYYEYKSDLTDEKSCTESCSLDKSCFYADLQIGFFSSECYHEICEDLSHDWDYNHDWDLGFPEPCSEIIFQEFITHPDECKETCDQDELCLTFHLESGNDTCFHELKCPELAIDPWWTFTDLGFPEPEPDHEDWDHDWDLGFPEPEPCSDKIFQEFITHLDECKETCDKKCICFYGKLVHDTIMFHFVIGIFKCH